MAGGNELRTQQRERKRIRVRFWDDEAIDAGGFTTDVSGRGLFIESVKEVEIGTRLHLELDLNGRPFFAEGVVARASKVHPSAKAVRTPGFGVRFVGMQEVIRGVSSEEKPADEQFVVDLRDGDELERIFTRDIRIGALLVQTDSPPEPGEIVRVRILLPDPPGAVVVRGAVQAQLPELPGIGLQLQEADQIRGLLSEILAFR